VGKPVQIRPRELFIVVLIALIGASFMVRLVHQPTYTDSYYHFNAAVRLATGQGLTDEYIWTYVGQAAPATVVPSHLYWMPLTSMLAGGSMALFNAPGSYAVAQLPSVLLFAGTVLIAYFLGYRLGGMRRHALVAAALTLFSGFFTKFWGEMDTFAPYAFAGSLCLLALENRDTRWLALAGLMAGFGHLTRSDGLLLFIVGILVLLIRRESFTSVLSFTAAYLLVMGGWFLRMIDLTGSPLPVGGLQAAWFTEYDDLFRYPPDANAAELFARGLFFETRWTAFIQNVQTFLFVEGYIVLMPLMLVGLWRRQVLSVILFALGIHAAMTLVFPFPGWRGGLLHGVAALIPWWAALAVVGLDSVVDWMAKRRRKWKPQTAKAVFSVGLVLIALALTLTNARSVRQSTAMPAAYAALVEVLPPDARVLINDPAQFYYYTGIGGAVLPNESPQTIAQIARDYAITHVILEGVGEIEGRTVSSAVPAPLQSIFEEMPPFLHSIEVDIPGVRLYRITPTVSATRYPYIPARFRS
jgi:hypothetical protein